MRKVDWVVIITVGAICWVLFRLIFIETFVGGPYNTFMYEHNRLTGSIIRVK